MADTTITDLTSASALTGAEVLPIDQAGVTVKVTIGAVASKSTASIFVTAKEVLTVAGSETLSIAASCKLFTYQINAQAGSGVYAWTINLSATNRIAGDKICLALAMDATANPTVNVKNIATTTIFSLTGNPSLAFKYQAWFTYDGTDWTLDE